MIPASVSTERRRLDRSASSAIATLSRTFMLGAYGNCDLSDAERLGGCIGGSAGGRPRTGCAPPDARLAHPALVSLRARLARHPWLPSSPRESGSAHPVR